MIDAAQVISPPNPHAERGEAALDPVHDARLRRGLIDTQVSRPVAVVLVLFFLALIYGVPVSQAVVERIDDEGSSLAGIIERAPTRENLRAFEKELDDASFAKAFVQPRIQQLLSRYGRAGNKRAVIGRDGYLFFAPGLTHLAGPSFIAPDAIEQRERDGAVQDDGEPVHADPRPVIFAFADMLARRGIELVVFPVPDKTMLQPAQLHGRVDSRRPNAVARNVGWSAFGDALRAHHIALFDPTPAALQPSDRPRFMVQDTHWTPAFMEQVARELADYLLRKLSLPAEPSQPSLHAVAQSVARVGDMVDVLKLPKEQSAFRPLKITIHQVQHQDGTAWQPDPHAAVLLLGDSFTNVYSEEYMGWGRAGGLGPQLALALGRGVDVIAQNDSGAFATRQQLFRALSAGEDPLAGKRVVVWEFAARELSVGDWKPLAWGEPTRAQATHAAGRAVN